MAFNDPKYLGNLGLGELYDETGETMVKLTEARYARGCIKNDLFDNDDRLSPVLIKLADSGFYKGEMTPSVFRKLIEVSRSDIVKVDERSVKEAVSTMRPYADLKDALKATVDFITEYSEGDYAMVSIDLESGYAVDRATLVEYSENVEKGQEDEGKATTYEHTTQREVRKIARERGLCFDGRELQDKVLHEVYRKGIVKLDVEFVNENLEEYEEAESAQAGKLGRGEIDLRSLKGKL